MSVRYRNFFGHDYHLFLDQLNIQATYRNNIIKGEDTQAKSCERNNLVETDHFKFLVFYRFLDKIWDKLVTKRKYFPSLDSKQMEDELIKKTFP